MSLLSISHLAAIGNDEQLWLMDAPEHSPRYLLVLAFPVYRHDGQLFVADLWRKDLELHFEYIESITLASPVRDAPPPAEFVALDPAVSRRIQLFHLPEADSIIPRPLHPVQEIRSILRISSIVRTHDIIHVTLNERPLIWGGLAFCLRNFTRKRMFVVVESTSSWRLDSPRLLGRIRQTMVEHFARMAARNAHFVVYTTEEYRRSLGPSRGAEAVIPASWIDEEMLAPAPREVQAVGIASRPLVIGYFAHLTREKGLDVLLNAVDLLKIRGCAVQARVYGVGPELDMLSARASTSDGAIIPLGTLPYGPLFHQAVRSCDVVAVPNRLDEQPRIVFDAFSQAVPVVGASTSGITSIVQNEINGLFFSPGSSLGLADALDRIVHDPELAARLSRNALSSARGRTHKAMHQSRARFLYTALHGFVRMNS